MMRRRLAIALLISTLALPEAASPEGGDASSPASPGAAEPSHPEEGAEGAEPASDAKRALTPYVPPPGERPAPRSRVSGGTRDLEGARAGPCRSLASRDGPTLTLLLPDRVASTAQPQPVLYWWASSTTTSAVDLSLFAHAAGDEPIVRALLNLRYAPPIEGGIHSLRLEEHGIRLEVGRLYEWSLERRAPAADAPNACSGFVRYEPDPRPDASAPGASWLDAFRTLTETIATRPHDTGLRRERAALLEQIGLDEVARWERPQPSVPDPE